MNTTMRQVLEIGHGGWPMGYSLQDFLDHMPIGVQYHGIDFHPDQAHSMEEFTSYDPIDPSETYPYKIR